MLITVPTGISPWAAAGMPVNGVGGWPAAAWRTLGLGTGAIAVVRQGQMP